MDVVNSAAAFAKHVLDAGSGFAKAILEGDAGNIVEQGFKIFGDIGSALLPAFAPFIKLGTDFFGGLVGGMFGQQARSTEDLERTRAGSNASRSAPAVQVAFNINEPRFTFDTDFHSPQTRQAMRAIFDDWMDEFVRRTGLATLLRDRLAVT